MKALASGEGLSVAHPSLVLVPEGDLDTEGCATFRREVATAMAQGLQHLVVDLSRVTSVRVEGARLLRGVETFLRRREGGLVLVGASGHVRSNLRVNGVDDLLTLRDRPFLEPLPPPALQEDLPAAVSLASRRTAG